MGTTDLVLALLVIQYVAAQVGLADGIDSPKQHIIGGQDADEGEYSFMVRWKLADSGFHMCGGSLIKQNVVLTAAHCVMNLGIKAPIEVVSAVVGDHTASKKEAAEQVMEVQRIIVHENYHTNLYRLPVDDIALIVLKRDVFLMDQVATVQLAVDDTLYAEGTPVTLIGWGIDSEAMQSADTLQELEYKIANEEECKQHWEAEYKAHEDVLGVVDVELDMDSILEHTFCAIDPAKEATAYSGDSGGPLFVKQGSTFTQIGITSWAEENPQIITYNMYANVNHYSDWITAALTRAGDEKWLELSTGGSHGLVMVHEKMGDVTTICNDKIGRNEVNSICQELGYKRGVLADARDYIPDKRKRKSKGQEVDVPPFGYTEMSCSDGAKNFMTECTMTEYKDTMAPCFYGDQLAVKCANEDWSFKVTNMIPQIKSAKGSEFAKGKFFCKVQAQKYGIDLDMKSQVKVGLVIRGKDGIEDIDENPMKYRKKTGKYIGKFKPKDEIMADSCFACIAYLPGAEFCAVAKYGPDDCPDNDDHYMEWVRKQNAAENGGNGGGSDGS